jgi:AcrR family transcriptional regulator
MGREWRWNFVNENLLARGERTEKTEVELLSSLERLLRATEIVVREKGCAKTTIQDVMQKSKLSKGGIFHYVKSKDELFAMLLKKKVAQVDESFHSLIANRCDVDLAEASRRIASAMFASANDEGIIHHIFVYLLGQTSSSDTSRLINDIYDHGRQLTHSWLQQAIDAQLLPVDYATDDAADLLMALTMGLRLQENLFAGELPYERPRIAHAFEAIIKGLKEEEKK